MGFDPSSDYPLGTRGPTSCDARPGSGSTSSRSTRVRAGRIGPEDLRATPETLRRQSAVALAAGRTQLADNLARAAELADGLGRDDPRDLHGAPAAPLDRRRSSRPGPAGSRASSARPLTAAFVREAADGYAERGLLGRDRAAV